MAEASRELEFEKAARVRDRLESVRKAIAKQQMVGDRSEDLDVIGLAEDDLEAAVQVFFVRKGRVVGRKGFIVDKVEALSPGELIEHVLEGLYDDPPLGIPKQVLVPTMPDDVELYEELPVRAAREPGSRSRCRSGARRSGSRRPWPTTPRRPSPATGSSGPATTTAGPGPSTSSRSTSVSPRRRCGSSATTCPTSRAPTTWARWWSPRTACPRSRTTGGSRSRRSTATTTSPPWRRSSAADSPPTSSSGRSRWGSGPTSSPTRPSSCSSTAARASCPAP